MSEHYLFDRDQYMSQSLRSAPRQAPRRQLAHVWDDEEEYCFNAPSVAAPPPRVPKAVPQQPPPQMQQQFQHIPPVVQQPVIQVPVQKQPVVMPSVQLPQQPQPVPHQPMPPVSQPKIAKVAAHPVPKTPSAAPKAVAPKAAPVSPAAPKAAPPSPAAVKSPKQKKKTSLRSRGTPRKETPMVVQPQAVEQEISFSDSVDPNKLRKSPNRGSEKPPAPVKASSMPKATPKAAPAPPPPQQPKVVQPQQVNPPPQKLSPQQSMDGSMQVQQSSVHSAPIQNASQISQNASQMSDYGAQPKGAGPPSGKRSKKKSSMRGRATPRSQKQLAVSKQLVEQEISFSDSVDPNKQLRKAPLRGGCC